jgi:EmrB/QacA subfamily drug resistance transporter
MVERLVTPENKKWWTLAAVSVGLFVIMLDNTVVNVALPSMRQSLHMTLSELEWVVAGYALTFAAFMLTGGKLADLLGRRLIFMAGLVVFTGASLACGLAPNGGFLIGARVVQGLGGALMNPSTLSIITATFPPKERGTAIGIWAGVSGMALAIGPLIGGLLTEHVNWNWIFFINVPVGAIGLVVTPLLIEETRDTSHEQRPDVPGLVSSAVGLFALTYGFIEANTYGWTSGRILGAFAVAAVALVVFGALELHQRLPMLDLSLFRNRTFSGANTAMLFVGLAMFGTFFYVSLYMQQILRYSPVEAGASFLPMTILVITIAPRAGKLSDRFGSRWLVGGGMTLLAIMLLYYSWLGLSESFWALLPGLILGAVADAYMAKRSKLRLVDLWVQALSESEDAVIAKALRRQIREVHAFFADLIRDGQEHGAVAVDRDPVAEAWIVIAGGLLATMDARLGLVGDELLRVRAERRRWMLAEG